MQISGVVQITTSVILGLQVLPVDPATRQRFRFVTPIEAFAANKRL